MVLSTLALEPGNRDYRAMNRAASAVSNVPTNGITRRAALGLGAAAAVGMCLRPEWLAAEPAKRKAVGEDFPGAFSWGERR